jgi:hypothetical protein
VDERDSGTACEGLTGLLLGDDFLLDEMLDDALASGFRSAGFRKLGVVQDTGITEQISKIVFV